MALSIIITILLAVQSCQQINGMHLTHITVPKIVDFRDKAELSCEYNMNGDALHSVKWYKDSMEFFRYAPEMFPKYMNFTVEGVKLADQMFNCDDTQCRVKLEQLRPQTSGVYRCEISGDAPHFSLIHGTDNMTVAAKPSQDPIITGLMPSYSVGDYIDANCTSDQSNPPTELTWYINERKVPMEYLQQQQETLMHMGEFTLYYRTLPLRFKIEKLNSYYDGKSFMLKCEATFDRYTDLTRAKTVKIFIVSTDVKSQQLVNSKNAATSITSWLKSLHSFSGFILIVILLINTIV